MLINNALEAKTAAVDFLRNSGGISNLKRLTFKNIQFIDGHWNLLIMYFPRLGTVLSRTVKYHMEINPQDGEIIAFYN
jgi:hypothetical protein